LYDRPYQGTTFPAARAIANARHIDPSEMPSLKLRSSNDSRTGSLEFYPAGARSNRDSTLPVATPQARVAPIQSTPAIAQKVFMPTDYEAYARPLM